MTKWTVRVGSCVAGGWLAALALSAQGNDRPAGSVTTPAGPSSQPGGAPDGSAHTAVVRRYCVGCHNERLKTGGLALDALDIGDPAAHAAEWEKVVTRLRAGTMPPSGLPRPPAEAQTALIGFLESELDRAWRADPNPGRIGAVHRLTARQYNTSSATCSRSTRRPPAVARRRDRGWQFRQLRRLAVDLDRAPRALPVGGPPGDASCLGLPPAAPGFERSRFRCMSLQDDLQSENLPLGSRGGIAVTFTRAGGW